MDKPETFMSRGSESIEFGCLRESDLEEAYRIQVEYLGLVPRRDWTVIWTRHPDLFVRCRVQGRMSGICYGRPAIPEGRDHGTITLLGIAVVGEFAGKGYGSRLLHFFEGQVEQMGGHTVTVGSAGGYVDHFYTKNGYKPVSFMICLPADRSISPHLAVKHTVAYERLDGDLRRLYVSVTSLDAALRSRLMADFNATEVVAIMEKRLTGPSQ